MPGTWIKLTNSPGFAASTMRLLTDGSVMCQESGGVRWAKLTSDSSGSYINGTWTPLAPMLNTRLSYASAVLRDGRVIVCGGEYSNAGEPDGQNRQNETNRCEINDPVAKIWTAGPRSHVAPGSPTIHEAMLRWGIPPREVQLLSKN